MIKLHQLDNLWTFGSENGPIITSPLPDSGTDTVGIAIGITIAIGLITLGTIITITYMKKRMDEHRLETDFNYNENAEIIVITDKNPNSNAFLYVDLDGIEKLINMRFVLGEVIINGLRYRTLTYAYPITQPGYYDCGERFPLVFKSSYHYLCFRMYKPYTLSHTYLSSAKEDLVYHSNMRGWVVSVLPDKPTFFFFHRRRNLIRLQQGLPLADRLQ